MKNVNALDHGRTRPSPSPVPAFWPSILLALWLPLAGCFRRQDTPPDANGTTASAGGESEGALSQIHAALAATENLETQQAARLWAELQRTFPDDPSIALNRALNAVLRVDQLTAQATDSVKTQEEKQAARQQLPEAIAGARSAAENYRTLSGDDVTALWLESRVDANEATLLGATLSDSLRRELFDRLVDAIASPIGTEPAAMILGGPLIELLEKMSDPVSGLPPEVLDPAATSLRRLSDANPDNLFLALRAQRLAIDRQDSEAVDLVERTWELAQAVTPTLATYTQPIGVTPRELTERIAAAVAEGDWDRARQSFVLWSNVLNPLEIVRADRRRASPHPLDLLSFDAVRRLSSVIAEANPIRAADDAGWSQFEARPIDQPATAVLPLDADLDLTLDLAVVTPEDRLELWQRQEGQWTTSATLELPVSPRGLLAADLFMVDSSDSERIKRRSGAGTADYSQTARHNTLQTIVLYGDFGVRLVQVDMRPDTAREQRLQWVEKTTGLETLPSIAAITHGDLEGDGDLDLIVAPSDGQIRTLINRGNRTFFEAPVGTSTVAEDDPVADMAIADLDRDIDLDVVTIHRSGRVGILENLLHLQFRFRYLQDVPAVPMGDASTPPRIWVEDVDANVGWDVIVNSARQSTVAFGNSSDIGVWTTDRVETGEGVSGKALLADFDNDSYFELMGNSGGVRLGPWGIGVLEAESPLPGARRGGAIADFNQDGSLDLVCPSGDQVWIGINQNADDGHYLAVRFKGIADNAAASGRVNHYAIGSVLELRFGPHYRSRIVTRPATHFGLDGYETADSIRVIMPNGLTQTIRDPEIDSLVEEEQTLKGSCPYLYSWDGEKFAFVTDCLWAAPLGLQVAAGQVQPDRPWEYLKIDGDRVAKNERGDYELRLTEELWEVAYVDQVELTAIDHPASVDVFSNEKVGPPSVAEPRVYAFETAGLLPPTSARQTDGSDVTAQLAAADERYVQGFDRRLRQGLCPPHWIDVDFGQKAAKAIAAADAPSVFLVLRGWILPTDTSLNIQIDQNPELPAVEFPSVWVPDATADSGWRQVIPFMGFPGGKTKTIVVDVTEHLRADDPRLRVRTSAQIYWDRAALAVQPSEPSVIRRAAPLRAAEVAFHGFSKRLRPHATAPERYDYAQASSLPKWPPLRGEVSRFGDSLAKLRQWDDQMVVISGGDEIRMSFTPPAEDPPPGWKRDFLLHCVGWDKDADLNTLTGQSIDPLPIKDMRAYPPDAASQTQFERVRQLNADSLRRRQSFRAFWRRGETHQPFLRSDQGG